MSRKRSRHKQGQSRNLPAIRPCGLLGKRTDVRLVISRFRLRAASFGQGQLSDVRRSGTGMGSAGLRLASTSGPLDLKSVLQTLAYLFTSIEFPSECVSDRTVVCIGDKETSVAAWSRSRGRCSSPRGSVCGSPIGQGQPGVRWNGPRHTWASGAGKVTAAPTTRRTARYCPQSRSDIVRRGGAGDVPQKDLQ